MLDSFPGFQHPIQHGQSGLTGIEYDLFFQLTLVLFGYLILCLSIKRF
jgi:hypothetical protein